ncbi:ABC transporter permease [Aeromicrobium sp. CTD01-1L150]|uniref:ABC transporter permease n=1 Tax=Aeromicrobium sp. CTD01-1L150 TaxID=3341830 RepID=UPI0035C18935
MIGFSVAIASSVIGGVLGAVVVIWRSVDNVIMRILDGLIAFPSIVLAILLVAAFGGGHWQVIVALTLVYFPRIARVVRGIGLSLIASPFVEAAYVAGGSRWWVMRHHVIPNLFGPIGVQGTYVMSRAIVIDAGLSFLGLSVPPPTPTWGNMLGDARLFMDQAWWMVVLPGLCIVFTALAVNYVGDWLRDITDKKLGANR